MKTEKRCRFIIDFAYFLIIAAVAFIGFKFLYPPLSPFIWGFIFAYVLRRPVRRVSRKFGVPHKLAAALTVTVFYLLLGGVITIIGVWLFSTMQDFVQSLPHLYTTHMVPFFAELFSNIEQTAVQMDESIFALVSALEVEISRNLSEVVSAVSSGAVGAVSNLATSLPGLFIKLVMLVISTFFISMDYQTIVGFCMAQMSEKGKTLFWQIKEYVLGTLFVCVRSYGLIMSITFVELSIALWIIGIKHGMLIAACISVFDILPVVGTGGVIIPWGVICIISGRVKLGIQLLLIYVAITVIRNIIEPKIVGGQLGLHPIVTLSSMFVGARVGGVACVFGFPILLSLLRYLNGNGTIRLFKDPRQIEEERAAKAAQAAAQEPKTET